MIIKNFYFLLAKSPNSINIRNKKGREKLEIFTPTGSFKREG